MTPQPQQFSVIFDLAVQLSAAAEADAILLMLESPVDWQVIKERAGNTKILVAADLPDEVAGATESGLATLVLNMEASPVFEKLTQALLESVGRELLAPGAGVIAVYSGFEPGKIDSLSYLCLEDHFGRLTARDLRKLETSVPLETVKVVLDLALEIGREGREGKPVGTMFVVGDTRRVLLRCHPAGFDPVKGYGRKERALQDPRVREAVKEIAPLDGAFIVSAEGIVEKSCQLIESGHTNITISKGLGARHWAAAAVSKATQAIAIVISESTGTVRLFQNGEVVLRVEPFRRAMKWKDFEYEPPPPDAE